MGTAQWSLLFLLASSLELCHSSFLDYGLGAGDTEFNGGNENLHLVSASSTIKIWKTAELKFYICSNGAILSQDYQSGNSSSSWQFLPDNSLYVYYADPKMNSLCGDCMIYYRTNISTPDLNKINIIIQKKDPSFAATSDSVLVTTWYKTAFQDNLNERNTFQAILASDQTTTYALISYDDLGHNPALNENVKVGFKGSENHFCSFLASNAEYTKLQCRSNVFMPGIFVVGLTANAQYQCNEDGNLEHSCSHCAGEETWNDDNCKNDNSTVCDNNGMEYPNKCKLEAEVCRTSGSITLDNCKKDADKEMSNRSSFPLSSAGNNVTSCNFESGTCGFFGAYWLRHRGSTPSIGTGPSVDASGSALRYYYYVEVTGTSFYRSYSTSAQVSNPSRHRTGCLKFAYHMHGTDISTLVVKASSRTVWSRTGDQGDVWRLTTVSLNQILGYSPPSVFMLEFVATKTGGFKSDVAIDDISITFDSDCSSDVMYPYGLNTGDRRVPSGDDTVFTYSLSKPMKLFSISRSQFHIGTNGLISFNRRISSKNISFPNVDTVLGLYITDLDSSRGGNIYYRETTSQQILSRATADVRKTGATTFTARRALIVSYILVNAYRSSSRHTFQGVITTDGSFTYAIMNYKKLERRSANAGYSEGFCNYEKFSSTINTANLMLTSNIGKQGRHVYKLTDVNCFTPASSVVAMTTTLSLSSSLFGTSAVSLGVLTPTAPQVVLMQLISGTYASSVYITSVAILNQSPTFGISYGLEYFPSRFNRFMVVQSLLIFTQAKKTSIFQYDHVILPGFSTGVVCHRNTFNSLMSTKPTVIAISNIGVQSMHIVRHVNLWLRNVTLSGFDICVEESVAFSGYREVSVYYLAVAGRSNNITENGNLKFTTKSDLCQNVKFQYVYSKTPNVFTTAEEVEGQNENGAIICWVKNITTTHVEICAKHSDDTFGNRQIEMKVNYIVTGLMFDECKKIHCPSHLEYRKNNRNQAYCGCISSCGTATDIFCGSDLVTYSSLCQLDKSHCEIYGNNSRHSVTVKHRGKCIYNCAQLNCPRHLECKKDNQNQAYCGCISSCGTATDIFCGSDLVTYSSLCQLDKTYCERYGTNGRHSVTVAYPGKCKGENGSGAISLKDACNGFVTLIMAITGTIYCLLMEK